MCPRNQCRGLAETKWASARSVFHFSWNSLQKQKVIAINAAIVIVKPAIRSVCVKSLTVTGRDLKLPFPMMKKRTKCQLTRGREIYKLSSGNYVVIRYMLFPKMNVPQ